MRDSHLAELLEVEEGEALREQLAVDDALAEARADPEHNAAGKLIERCAHALNTVLIVVLEAVPENYPVYALAGLRRPRGAAVPDQLGIEARTRDLVIF